jgi:hypothetical protein
MADTLGSGASALLGNPAQPPAPAGGDPAGGAPPVPPVGGDWLSGLGVADPEISTWASSKGWKSPADAFASHRNLEKLLGGEKVPVPKGDDPAAWELFYKAAGRPDAPDAYGLDKLEGADPAFAKAAAEHFHALGLSATQATKLAAWYNEQATNATKGHDEAFTQQSQVEWDGLKREWGSAFDAKSEAARRATKQFGIDQGTLDKLERGMGTKGMMELLSKVGQSLGESPAYGMGREGGGDQFMTPADAQSQIAALMQDREFIQSVYDGNAAARAKLDRLQRLSLGTA